MFDSTGRPWLLALPLAVVLLVAGAWSLYWMHARDTARAGLADLRSDSVRLDCGREHWSGFPFRITLICDDAAFGLGRGTVALSGSARRIAATARAYRPEHVILELAPPYDLAIDQAPGAAGDAYPDTVRLSSDAAPLRTGLLLGSAGIAQATLKTENWRASLRLLAAGRTVDTAELAAERLAVHWRAGDGSLDISIDGEGLHAANAPLAGLRGGPLRLDVLQLAASLSHADRLAAPLRPDSLRAWRDAGGEIGVSRLLAESGPHAARGTATLRLDERGRPAGRLELSVRGLKDVFDALVEAGRLTSSQAVLAAGAIRLLAQNRADQAPDWTPLTVRLTGGRAYVGPFKALKLEPVL